ncbi:MAG: biotin/lipoyl-binding protein [Chloroflexi bacterium]|nr:biotin/lipoyl-binding protein [Chloroflexota bacterium]
MTTRRLQQLHPPITGAVDPLTQTELEVDISRSGHWEGRVLLDDGRTVPFLAIRDRQQVHVWIGGEYYLFGLAVPARRTRGPGQWASDDIVCPVPGVVISVRVAENDVVEAGQDLVIIESMKTEQIVRSPRHGTVQRVSVQEGDRVDRGMRLVVLHPLTEESGPSAPRDAD